MDYAQRAVRGSFAISVLAIVSVALGFFLRTFLARNLSVEDFGLLYAVLAFIGLFSLFRDVGLNPALIKYIPEFMVKKDLTSIKSSVVFTFCLQFCVALLAMAPVFAFSSILSQHFFKTALSIPVTHFLALTFVASVLFHLMQSFFQGMQRMKLYAILEPLRLAIVLGVCVVAVVLGFGVAGASAAYFAGIVVSGAVGLLLALNMFPFFSVRMRVSRKLARTLFAFAFPVILAGAVSVLTGYTDTLLLTLFKTLADVGYYQAAVPISEAANLFVVAMSIVAFPMISELWARGKKDMITDGMYLLMKASALVLIPAAVVILVSADLIVPILFTDKYMAAVPALRILAFAVVFQSLSILLFSLLKGIGKPMAVTKIVALLAVTDFAANLLLIPPFGITGAAFATVLAFAVAFLASVASIRRQIRVRLPYRPAFKAALSGTVMAVFIISIRPLVPADNLTNFAVTTSLGLLVYAFSVVLLGAVKRKDIRILGKIIPLPGRLLLVFRE